MGKDEKYHGLLNMMVEKSRNCWNLVDPKLPIQRKKKKKKEQLNQQLLIKVELKKMNRRCQALSTKRTI